MRLLCRLHATPEILLLCNPCVDSDKNEHLPG
jgi:hypothetical protein